MQAVELLYNVLTKDEEDYIYDLINDKSKWIWRTNYNQRTEGGGKLWYDSILPDYDKLKNYHNFICDNEKYLVRETAINIIQYGRQYKNSIHADSGDLSYATYFNENFKGGELVYFNENQEKFIIKPKKGLTLKINKGVFHSVEEVTEGVRFSLYTFLMRNPKNQKSLI